MAASETGVPANWQALHAWWQANKELYNVPEIARRAGLHKGRVYAALAPGSQGGSTVRFTDELFEQLTKVLGTHFQLPPPSAPATAPARPDAPLAADELRRLYEQEQLSVQQIADRVNVPHSVIRRLMAAERIPTRTHVRVSGDSFANRITRDRLCVLAHGGLTAKQIATRYNVSEPLIAITAAKLNVLLQEEKRAGAQAVWRELRAFVLSDDEPTRQKRTAAAFQANARRSKQQLLAELEHEETTLHPNHLQALADRLGPLGFTSTVYAVGDVEPMSWTPKP